MIESVKVAPWTPCAVFISGPPAAGKSTLSDVLAKSLPKSVVIPVDDVRQWVRGGMADSVPWTEETEAQFQMAEAAVADVARRYIAAGFVVILDHCRNPQRLDTLINDHLSDVQVRRILLVPELSENLRRSHTRTNKSFDPHMLDETIQFTNEHYRKSPSAEWCVIDNSRLSVEETLRLLMRPEPATDN